MRLRHLVLRVDRAAQPARAGGRGAGLAAGDAARIHAGRAAIAGQSLVKCRQRRITTGANSFRRGRGPDFRGADGSTWLSTVTIAAVNTIARRRNTSRRRFAARDARAKACRIVAGDNVVSGDANHADTARRCIRHVGAESSLGSGRTGSIGGDAATDADRRRADFRLCVGWGAGPGDDSSARRLLDTGEGA